MITNYKNQFAYLDMAEPWQLGFQDPATPIMEGIINFHHDLMFFLIIVTVFVCWLLLRVVISPNNNMSYSNPFLVKSYPFFFFIL